MNHVRLNIYIVVLLPAVFVLSCDLQNQQEGSCNHAFNVVEEMPKLLGGIIELIEKIEYPDEAFEKGIEGRVMVGFVVDKEGRPQNIEILRSIGGGADEEAVRVVKTARFEPGKTNGIPVCVEFVLPVAFTLPNSG